MVVEHALLSARPGAEGYFGSQEYQRWGALLHHFYERFPAVEHFLVG